MIQDARVRGSAVRSELTGASIMDNHYPTTLADRPANRQVSPGRGKSRSLPARHFGARAAPRETSAARVIRKGERKMCENTDTVELPGRSRAGNPLVHSESTMQCAFNRNDRGTNMPSTMSFASTSKQSSITNLPMAASHLGRNTSPWRRASCLPRGRPPATRSISIH